MCHKILDALQQNIYLASLWRVQVSLGVVQKARSREAAHAEKTFQGGVRWGIQPDRIKGFYWMKHKIRTIEWVQIGKWFCTMHWSVASRETESIRYTPKDLWKSFYGNWSCWSYIPIQANTVILRLWKPENLESSSIWEQKPMPQLQKREQIHLPQPYSVKTFKHIGWHLCTLVHAEVCGLKACLTWTPGHPCTHTPPHPSQKYSMPGWNFFF